MLIRKLIRKRDYSFSKSYSNQEKNHIKILLPINNHKSEIVFVVE